jgi:outer membrane biosynthesis protein TonB
MKTKFLVMSSAILVLVSACNSSSTSNKPATDSTTVVPDTTAKVTDTATASTAVVSPPAIDSAAVTREYLAAQKKTKKTTPPKPKKQGKDEVEMYTEAPIPSHEALEQPAPIANAPKETQVIHTKEYVYFTPSEEASFPGGMQHFAEYLQKNIVYPDDALKYRVQGTVYADVYLDSLGHVTEVEFNADQLGSGLEEETRLVLMHSPRWNPAKENGKPVSSKITLPVVYKIS